MDMTIGTLHYTTLCCLLVLHYYVTLLTCITLLTYITNLTLPTLLMLRYLLTFVYTTPLMFHLGWASEKNKTTAPRIPAWSPTVVLTGRHSG